MKRKRSSDDPAMEIPHLLLVEIMRFVGHRDQMRAACTCRSWDRAVKEAREGLRSLQVEGGTLTCGEQCNGDLAMFPKVGRSITIFVGEEFTQSTLQNIHKRAGNTLRGLHIVVTKPHHARRESGRCVTPHVDFSNFDFPVLEYLHLENISIDTRGEGALNMQGLEHLSIKGDGFLQGNGAFTKEQTIALPRKLPELRSCLLENVHFRDPIGFVHCLQFSPFLSDLRVKNAWTFPFFLSLPCQFVVLKSCKVLEWVGVLWFPIKVWAPRLERATMGNHPFPEAPAVEILDGPPTQKEKDGTNHREHLARISFLFPVAEKGNLEEDASTSPKGLDPTWKASSRW